MSLPGRLPLNRTGVIALVGPVRTPSTRLGRPLRRAGAVGGRNVRTSMTQPYTWAMIGDASPEWSTRGVAIASADPAGRGLRIAPTDSFGPAQAPGRGCLRTVNQPQVPIVALICRLPFHPRSSV
jgi:hypothetical protein